MAATTPSLAMGAAATRGVRTSVPSTAAVTATGAAVSALARGASGTVATTSRRTPLGAERGPAGESPQRRLRSRACCWGPRIGMPPGGRRRGRATLASAAAVPMSARGPGAVAETPSRACCRGRCARMRHGGGSKRIGDSISAAATAIGAAATMNGVMAMTIGAATVPRRDGHRGTKDAATMVGAAATESLSVCA